MKSSLLGLGLVGLSLAVGLAPTPVRAATLLYSNDVLGEVEPCGCRVDPMGGVIRRSGLLARLTKAGKGPFIQIDTGDFLFESKDFPETLEDFRECGEVPDELRAESKPFHAIPATRSGDRCESMR